MDQQIDVNVKGIDPQKSDPYWLKVLGAASSFGIICFLLMYLVFKVANNENNTLELIESQTKTIQQMQDRFDKTLENHDNRIRDWVKAQGERNQLEHDKTRLEMKTLTDQVRLMIERLK